MKKSAITIRRLCADELDTIRQIARWYHSEWETPIKKTVSRLTSQPDDDTLFQLIAETEGRMVATGGLCNTVNIYNFHDELRALGPWVGLLYTRTEYRNRGVGTQLLQSIEHEAKEMGRKKIYLYTFTAETLYRRCGWQCIDRVLYKEHDTSVMTKTLT